MAVERLTIVLSEREAAVLRGIAQADLRKPRDQARWLLRQALQEAEQRGIVPRYAGNANRAGKGSEATPSAVAG